MLEALRLVLVWGIILTIAVLYFKPIVLCFWLVYKSDAGLPVPEDLFEVESLLLQNPWKEEQILELRDLDSEAPYLYLSGYYTGIILRKKDDKLVAGIGAIVSPRKSYWEIYEANQLLQYIFCLSANEDNGEADKLREQTQAMLASKEGRNKAQKWLGRAVIFAEIVALVFVLLYAKGKAEAPSSLVKNMIFSDFHYTKTVGSALNGFDSNGEWFDISEKNALKNNGVAYAGWQGTCQSTSILGQTENWPLTIYFEIMEMDTEGKYYVSIDQITFDQYSLSSSNLLQSGTIWDIMNMVYGNQENVAVVADTGLFNMTYFLRKKGNNPPTVSQTTPVPEPPIVDGKETEDRFDWEYEDFVAYYGIDPADYGYVWYSEIKNGPLDEFFEWTVEMINGETNTSRLLEEDWPTNLTGDDFVGTWQTEGGIIFTIDYIDGTYTIDFTENENLHIFGGLLSSNHYNIEGEFCGMSGANGVTSFSVIYEYSTSYPEKSWLQLEFTDTEGTAVTDHVPLYGYQ